MKHHLSTMLLSAALCPLLLAAEPAAPVPRPGTAPDVPLEMIAAARDRGVAYLLASQNKDGSWGSCTQTKGLNISADIPGAHYAFTTATTSLAIEALILSGPESPAVKSAIDRAGTWLVGILPKVRRASDSQLYNCWAHSYAIKACLALRNRPETSVEKKAELLGAARSQVAMLERFEFLNGGWGYYDFEFITRKPTGIGTSFTTATALIALRQARDAGIEVPQEMIDNAMRALLMQRTPDGAFVYSFDHRKRPRLDINRPAGSLGRAPACNAALRVWTGTEHISDQDIKDWLDRLITRGGWLDVASKRPIPHEAWFKNSGYFLFYGQYYAAYCTLLLPEKDRPFYRAHLAKHLMELQEADGSWWDYPLYSYHQPYGTSYVLSALAWLEPRLKTTPAAAVKSAPPLPSPPTRTSIIP